MNMKSYIWFLSTTLDDFEELESHGSWNMCIDVCLLVCFYICGSRLIISNTTLSNIVVFIIVCSWINACTYYTFIYTYVCRYTYFNIYFFPFIIFKIFYFNFFLWTILYTCIKCKYLFTNRLISFFLFVCFLLNSYNSATYRHSQTHTEAYKNNRWYNLEYLLTFGISCLFLLFFFNFSFFFCKWQLRW